MRSLSLLLLLVCFGASAATFTSVNSGDWTNDAIWSSAPADNDCTPAGNHTYNINNYVSTACSNIFLSGSVTINVASGATLYITGSASITGTVKLNIKTGGAVVITGNLNLGGASDVIVDGALTVNGNISGVGSSFDCNGTGNAGTVTIGGTGCANCTNSGDAGCNASAPLPVNLSTFDAVSTNNAITISWTTTFENNNDRFILERSTDGISFTTIYVTKGQSNTESRSDYAFTDVVSAGTYYYHLIQVDKNGSKTMTDMVSETLGATMQLSVFPNPGNAADMKLTLNNADNAVVMIVLTDVNGNTVYADQHTLTAGALNISDLNITLNAGIYYISVNNNDIIINNKIILY